MPYYVMLEFENDEEAVEFIQEAGRNQSVLPHKLRGVWKKPTKFCECQTNLDHASVYRGQKYGWWVHKECLRPSRVHVNFVDRMRMRIGSLGFNLLPPEFSGEDNSHWLPKEFLKINS